MKDVWLLFEKLSKVGVSISREGKGPDMHVWQRGS